MEINIAGALWRVDYDVQSGSSTETSPQLDTGVEIIYELRPQDLVNAEYTYACTPAATKTPTICFFSLEESKINFFPPLHTVTTITCQHSWQPASSGPPGVVKSIHVGEMVWRPFVVSPIVWGRTVFRA